MCVVVGLVRNAEGTILLNVMLGFILKGVLWSGTHIREDHIHAVIHISLHYMYYDDKYGMNSKMNGD